MAYYSYDEEADALYITLVPDDDARIDRTDELGPNLHIDLDENGKPVGVEILYRRNGGVDLGPLRDRYGIDLKLPFSFAA